MGLFVRIEERNMSEKEGLDTDAEYLDFYRSKRLRTADV
jgi:hypothetical protein